MRQKILVVCGPTATGKTSLGLRLAQYFSGEIISADSRQIYTGLDIGTGKDLPNDAEWVESPGNKIGGYYEIQKIKLWGYDIALASQEFSAAHFAGYANQIFMQMRKQEVLPIMVGGSGHYIQAALYPPETLGVPVNSGLREELESYDVPELQKRLKKQGRKKFETMNNSDRQNPRRLIRAIEVTESEKKIPSTAVSEEWEVLWIGLKGDWDFMDKRIENRVRKRATKAFDAEVQQLMSQDNEMTSQAFTATGYADWAAYLKGQMGRYEAMELWMRREKQYARRQMTWFRKNKQIHWFSIESQDYEKAIVALVNNWYASCDDTR